MSKANEKGLLVWLNKGGFKFEVHFCNKCFKEVEGENNY